MTGEWRQKIIHSGGRQLSCDVHGELRRVAVRGYRAHEGSRTMQVAVCPECGGVARLPNHGWWFVPKAMVPA